eukprot:CAMPEP_0204840022 /NCGR_PEP_ID=MMETSP1346-20131115/36055_1 /ASSEMBLY_ACC=CAM_ASM_000771 /TAXON_ID=215587 /ORGANISM="Aplanochytrium stocchinoi, Strain GSBS06" /LENGTH=94 /DNA_ID=CAMNT_0051977143 /DNA_START=52 /DNA_END=333 /DNA_ORIENTATION=-
MDDIGNDLKRGAELSDVAVLYRFTRAANELSSIVGPTFGPTGYDLLLLSPHKSVTISNSGASVIESLALSKSDAVSQFLLNQVLDHETENGDGT